MMKTGAIKRIPWKTKTLLAILFASSVSALAADPTTTLWFDKPAASFHGSLPLGNGRLGAMVFGGVDEERIVLNESSVWSGSPGDDNREGAHAALPEIRRLLAEGKNREAEALVNQTFTCKGPGSGGGRGANVPFGCYQVLGNLRLKFQNPTPAGAVGANATAPSVGNYTRTLDLRSGEGVVSYQKNGHPFTREHFISAPDEVFVSRLSGPVSVTLSLDRPERFQTTTVNDNELLMTGTLNDGRGGKGITYAGRLRVVARGGSVKAEGNNLVVTDAEEVVLFFAAATDYRGFAGRQLSDPLAATTADLDKAAAKSFEDLRAAQRADHQKWFDRVELHLPATANSALPTDARLAGFAKGDPDPALAALYFNFGRYLLICSSRPGGLPANLQGIWAEEIQTPWNGGWAQNRFADEPPPLVMFTPVPAAGRKSILSNLSARSPSPRRAQKLIFHASDQPVLSSPRASRSFLQASASSGVPRGVISL